MAGRRRYKKTLVVLLLLAIFGANAFAYVHARALTRFLAAGQRTPDPEKLDRWQKLEVLFLGARVPRPVNTKTPATVGLPFETRTIPVGEAIELEAWLIRQPAGRGWIYLFHGYAASKEQQLETARRFFASDWNLMLVDFRGSGGSKGADSTSLGYHEAEDVAAAVRWGRSNLGVEAPILYGFSMGGAAVMRAAGELGTPGAALIVESVFDRMLGTVERRFQMMGLPAFPMARLLVFWGGVQNGFSALAHNPVDYAGKIRCPVLLVHGERDQRVALADVESIHRRLAGPNELRIVPGAGHEATEKMTDQDWQEMIGGFLGKYVN
jgi:uncharacterized protein